jgi:ribose transport system substrate-binding protein
MTVMKGKTIFDVSTGTEDEFIQIIESVEAGIAKKVGFKFVSWANSGKVQQWQQGVSTAIKDHASLIDLFSLNPQQIAPPVAAAVKAGIPVVSTDAYDLSHTPPASLHLSAYVAVPYAEAGRLMADWATVATQGKVDALVIGSPDVPASVAQVAAMKSEFGRVSPACKVDYTGITVADWASQTEKTVAAAIRSDPALNYVLPVRQ